MDVQIANNKEKKMLLLIQSIIRAWIATRLARKRIRKHVFRTKIANELLQTELSYLRDIRTIHQEFQLGATDIMNHDEQKILFMNIKEIIPIHIEISKMLQSRIKSWSYHQTIADVLQFQMSNFRIYKQYVTSYKDAASYLQKHRASSVKLDKFLHSKESNTYCRGMKFESFLVMPIQRLPRYILLLKELKKYTDPTHPDYPLIVSVMKELDDLAKSFNEAERDRETNKKVLQIMNTVLGAEAVVLETPFIYEGAISYKKITRIKQGLKRSMSFKKEGEGFIKEVWKDIYVFLFKDTMLCAKKISNSAKSLMGPIHGKMGFYKFSKTRAHELTPETKIEVNSDNSCMFSLVYEFEEHEFQTTTPQARELWINALEKTLASFGQRRHTVV